MWTRHTIRNCAVRLVTFLFITLSASPLGAGTYLDSAHGNNSYGASRSSTSGYTKGNCAHCHEMHTSIDGNEPSPAGGSPTKFTLFYTNHVSQTDNFCFKCHDNTITVAATAIMNRSYSFRAGGWTADPLNDILEAFTTGGPTTILSVHNLDNISTFITSKAWGYTANSNPCCACHNPHAVQGDPANSGSTAKSSGTRGYPISRPSLHATPSTWGLWGDGAGEKMSNYTASYQSPYRFGSTTTYEPDGSATTNGSNLTDINTFCIDCHNATNTIYSTNLGRNLKTIDWDNEKHGKGLAEVAITVDAPYSSTMGYVLSCTDCHEPHGSPNAFLIRKEVNGGTLGGTISTFSTTNWKYLCARCHQEDTSPCRTTPVFEYIHHNSGTDRPYTQTSCGGCHGSGGGCPPTMTCSNCHFHGSSRTDCDYAPATRRTF
jgi:hypothetical protein